MGKYRPLRARGVKNIRRAGDGADARARRRRSRSSVVGRLRPVGTGATRFPRGGGPRLDVWLDVRERARTVGLRSKARRRPARDRRARFTNPNA